MNMNEMENEGCNRKTSIIMNTKNCTITQMLKLFFSIEEVYAKNNINILNINVGDVIKKEVSESEYELYKGTEFANTETVYEPRMFTKYVPRQQVYDAIIHYAKPEKVEEITEKMDKKFPKEKFGEDFPYCASAYLLYKHYLK